MKTGLRWLGVALLALSTIASAAAEKKEQPKKEQPKKEEPKKPSLPESGKWLVKDQLWYVLYVPENYDPKEECPLLVAVQSSDDGAKRAFESWLDVAKSDRLFLASLNFPKDTKEDKEHRLAEMVVQILKDYEGIDPRALVLVGSGAGADAALKFVAAHPRVFDAALILSPDKYPDISKIRPAGPRVTAGTNILVPIDPKSEDQRKKFTEGAKDFARHNLRLKPLKIEAGEKGADEHELALKAIRSHYSAAKRVRLAAALRQENGKKGEEGTEEGTKEPGKIASTEPAEQPAAEPKAAPKAEKSDPDALLMKARDLDQKRDFGEAFKTYQTLADENPGTDYARVALDRIEELKADPKVRQTIADAEAGPQCRSLLTRARNFALAKMYPKAIEDLQRVVDNYAGTSYADEAQKEILRLRKLQSGQ